MPPERSEILRTRLDAFADGAERIHEGDAEAVHRTRVASRRLRELVLLLELNSETASKLGQRLAKVTKRLGIVRALDVSMHVIDELRYEGGYSSTVLQQLGNEVGKERAAARERLAQKLPPHKLRAIVKRLRRAAKHLESIDEPRRRPAGPRQGWLLALEALVARRGSALQTAIDGAAFVYDPERLHRVRVALKKFRYATELLAEARPQRAAAAIGSLRAAQDLLGRLHDLQVLIERTRALQASVAPLDLDTADRLGSFANALDVTCRHLHARFLHDRQALIALADRTGHLPAEANSRTTRRQISAISS